MQMNLQPQYKYTELIECIYSVLLCNEDSGYVEKRKDIYSSSIKLMEEREYQQQQSKQ